MLGLVRELTAGRGADYVFVTVGSPAAVSQALTLARRGGTLVLVGMPAAGATAPIPIGDFAGNGLRLLGSNMGSTRLGVDVPRLVARYREGRLQLDELITGPLPARADQRGDRRDGGGRGAPERHRVPGHRGAVNPAAHCRGDVTLPGCFSPGAGSSRLT